MGIKHWLNSSTEEIQAEKLAKRQKEQEAQKARLNQQTAGSTGASNSLAVLSPQSFVAPSGIAFAPSETMQQQLLGLVSDKLTLIPVYLSQEGKVFTHEQFAELQSKSEFALQGKLSARYVSKQADQQGNMVVLNDPVPPEGDILAYLASAIAKGYKPLCDFTPPATPATAPVTAGSTPATTTDPATTAEPAEQGPPNFIEAAARELGYADGVSLTSLNQKQLAALHKRAAELEEEYEKEQQRAQQRETVITRVAAAAERVAEWDDPELQLQFVALVEAASQPFDDTDLSGLTEESRQMLKLMSPQVRTMVTSTINNPALLKFMSLINMVDPESEAAEDDANNTGRSHRRRDSRRQQNGQPNPQQGQKPEQGPNPPPPSDGGSDAES